MRIVVRPAGPADAELLGLLNADVQAVHATAFPALFKPPDPLAFVAEATRLFDKPENLVFIAEADAAPAGYAYAAIVHEPETPLRYPREILTLHHLGVRPQLRGRGVGRALLDRVRSVARQRGIAAITVSVWTFNDEARALYRRYGFTPFQEQLTLG